MSTYEGVFVFYGDKPMTAIRETLHAKMIKEPQRAVLVVFHITSSTHVHLVQRVFEDCATLTGFCTAVSKQVELFQSKGEVPSFVLQCCSARAEHDNIGF